MNTRVLFTFVFAFSVFPVFLVGSAWTGSFSGGGRPSIGTMPSSLPDPPTQIEAGRCENYFAKFLGIGIGSYYDEHTKKTYEVSHHDVYFDFIDEGSEETEITRIGKGFFQTEGNRRAKEQLKVWRNSKKIFYINGVVKNRSSDVQNRHCDVEASGTSSTGDVDQIFSRFRNTSWTEWHILFKNCQSWADFVLTGTEPAIPQT